MSNYVSNNPNRFISRGDNDKVNNESPSIKDEFSSPYVINFNDESEERGSKKEFDDDIFSNRGNLAAKFDSIKFGDSN